MDSLSQLALGAGVGVAVMGRRTAVWRAALWGAVCGTLPDLDALIDHGDPVRNMTFHRAESHSLLYLTLLSPAIAAGVARLHGESDRFGRWWLALWLALFTHPLLDNMTIYGTQLLQPFTDHPFWIGSLFIIDPLYTLPLLIGLLGTALARGAQRWRWNAAGIALSTLYLAWSVIAQQHVSAVAERALHAQGVEVERLLVTPTPFNTVLWRILAMDADGSGYHEAFYSLADGARLPRFDSFERDAALHAELANQWAVARMTWFSHGFYRMREVDGRALIADLRMGQEPGYVFEFAVAARGSPWQPIRPVAVGSRGDTRAGLAWLWRRLQGEELPPPRDTATRLDPEGSS